MSDPADSAVIQILLDRLGNGYTKYSPRGVPEERLVAHEREIAKVREWSRSLGWFEGRRYRKWLDVWQRGVDEYREEQRTGADQKYWNNVRAKIDAENMQTARLKEQMPKPPQSR